MEQISVTITKGANGFGFRLIGATHRYIPRLFFQMFLDDSSNLSRKHRFCDHYCKPDLEFSSTFIFASPVRGSRAAMANAFGILTLRAQQPRQG